MGVHETNLYTGLKQIDCDQASFSVYSGVSPTRLSLAFNGSKDFTGPEIQKLTRLLAELREIVEDAKPIPINFRNLDGVKRLLELKRGGISWTAAVHDEETEHVEQ